MKTVHKNTSTNRQTANSHRNRVVFPRMIWTNSACEARMHRVWIKFVEFRNSGRLGCPNDYVEFRDELMPLLENIHGIPVMLARHPVDCLK